MPALRDFYATLSRRPVALALVLAVVVRLGWLAVAEVGVGFQRPPPRELSGRSADGLGYLHTPVQTVDMWTRWDGRFYVDIAEQGYVGGGERVDLRPAFFPLYPLLMRALAAATGMGAVAAGLVINNLADLLAWVLLALFVERRLGRNEVAPVLVAFALFPTRNFGFSINTEGLYLLAAVSAFYLYERKQVAGAALVSALASALRPQGAFIGAALLADALWRRFVKKEPDAPRLGEAAVLCLFPAGLLAYVAYLGGATGDPLRFMEVQQVWHRGFTTPVHTLLARSQDPHVYVVLLAAVFLVYALWAHKWPVRDLSFAGASVLMPLLSGSLQSFVRFTGVIFPLFMLAAVICERRPRLRWFYVAVAIVYSAVFAFKVGQFAAVT